MRFKEDFFDSVRIKKLRRLAGGDTLTIIYLKMQLKSIKTDGVLTYTGVERTFAEELALDLDENPEDVGLLLNYLLSVGLIETSDNINFLLPFVVENTGSETAAAERMRNHRERKALPENTNEMSPETNTSVTMLRDSYAPVTEELRDCYVEKDIEKDIEQGTSSRDSKSKRFIPPTVEEVMAYCKERKNSIDAQYFVDWYTAKGWMIGKNKMKDWKATVRYWERKENTSGKSPPGNKTRLQDRHNYDYAKIEEELFGEG